MISVANKMGLISENVEACTSEQVEAMYAIMVGEVSPSDVVKRNTAQVIPSIQKEKPAVKKSNSSTESEPSVTVAVADVKPS